MWSFFKKTKKTELQKRAESHGKCDGGTEVQKQINELEQECNSRFKKLEDDVLADLLFTHHKTLIAKRKKLVITDDYGLQNIDKWQVELDYFYDNVYLTAILAASQGLSDAWLINKLSNLHHKQSIKSIIDGVLKDPLS